MHFLFRAPLCLMTASLILAWQGGESWAQADPVAAEVLFRAALRLTEAGELKAACPKFEQSYRLSGGIGALYHFADCLERTGRTASAWAGFLEVVKLAQRLAQPEREHIAQARANALEPTLSRLTIGVAHTVPELRILRDGAELSTSLWGLAVPVDPGKHDVVAVAPGYVAWHLAAEVLGQGHSVVVDVPELEVDRALKPVEPPVVSQAKPKSTPANSSPSPEVSLTGSHAHSVGPALDHNSAADSSTSGLTPRETVGWVLGGIGVIGVAAGALAGFYVLKANAAADEICPSGRACSENETGDFDNEIATARTARTAAIAGLAAGTAALVAGGTLLWFEYGAASDVAELSASAGHRHVGVGLRARF